MLPYIFKAYMKWRYGDPSAHDPEVLPTEEEITVIDIYSTATKLSFKRFPSHSIAEDLALNGYLATAPLHPELAISFKTLELFRSIRLFKASFSTEAFAKLLCHMYTVRIRFSVPGGILIKDPLDTIPSVLSHGAGGRLRYLSYTPA